MSHKRNDYWLALLVMLGLIAIIFLELLRPGVILFSTDNNIGQNALTKALMPDGFTVGWTDSLLMGTPAFVPPSATFALLHLLPVITYTNWIHALFLGGSSLFLGLFLRDQGVRLPAILMGLLTAFWVGSNLTLIYAGHTSKFGILFFVALYLWTIQRAVRKGSARWACLAGVAVGMIMVEQPDVGLFFVLALGPYALWHLLRPQPVAAVTWVRVLLPLALVSLLVSSYTLLRSYQSNVQDIAAVSEENARAKWDFATQWSWPPEESIDFIAPGYTGWRSGEPEGPYWGRMGRSAGWEQTGQGFQNFKLENQYLGAIPLVFAFLSMVLAVRRRVEGQWLPFDGEDWRNRRGEIRFWVVTAVLTLLLAFGKNFPLYALFFKLPFVSNIRNPNKFLQIFQLAVGLLAAHGFDLANRWVREPGKASSRVQVPGGLRILIYAVFGVSVLLFLWTVALMLGWNAEVNRLTVRGWGDYASVIVGNRIRSLGQGAFLTFCAGGFLAFVFLARPKKQTAHVLAKWALVGMVALDAVLLSRHYIKTIPQSTLAENEVIRILKSVMPDHRVALISQEGFYNAWLTYLFPLYGIQAVNVTQMPRMPVDYKNFLEAVARNPVRYWQLAAVGCVLAPAQVWSQIQNDPALRDAFDLLWSYNVVPAEIGAQVVPASPSQPGQHVILRFKKLASRFALIAGWQSVSDTEALRDLASNGFPLFQRVLVAPEHVVGLPSLTGTGMTGSVQRLEYRPGRMKLKVIADVPAILRVSEKYDPGWKAWIDGRLASVLRVDYLCQGLYMPPGVHDVLLSYQPAHGYIVLQMIGLILGLGAMISLILGNVPLESSSSKSVGS